MAFADDTADLVATTYLGESVTIRRNTPTYDDGGAATDGWATVITANADIQPIDGNLVVREIGQERLSTHKIFLPSGTAVRGGDRIRGSAWAAGSDEYLVDAVLYEEGHVEVRASIVAGHG